RPRRGGGVGGGRAGAGRRLGAARAGRGLSLWGARPGLALAGGARAAVSAPAAAATARAAAAYAAGDMVHGLSPKVVTLAEGALKIMFATRPTLATVLLLAAALLGAGALAVQQQAASATEPRPSARPAQEKDGKAPAPAEEKSEAVEVKGRVLDPEGKPFAGAQVRLWTAGTKSRDASPVRATTGADGGFRFSARKEELAKTATV